MDVAGVWVTEYLSKRKVLRSVAFWMNGQYVEDYEYNIEGTPCEVVIEERRLVHYPDRIIELFPNDPDLTALNAVSYAGVPFFRSDGTVLGHFSALDTKSIDLQPDLEAVFRIFADRAAAELNRLCVESAIRESELRFSGLFESAMDSIIEMDGQFRIQRANSSAASLFGLPADELINSKLTALLTPASAQKLANVAFALEPQNRQFAWVSGGLDAARSDGTTLAAEASVSRFDLPGGCRYSLILRNVQDQIAAENRLRELELETAYLLTEIAEHQNGGEIIGNSQPIRAVVNAVHQVAPTPATVLISGETGTGKELVARAIHQVSDRSARPFVRINCGAIPAALCESEFFGHERGAFTSAVSQKKGLLEVAEGGTVFLDEVAELPPTLQAKLLRVLQEREFVRLGGTSSIKLNVRFIAATNKDLQKAVTDEKFRLDLFYRLNVVYITMPALREHPEDIPLLTDHFVSRYSARSNRKVRGLSPAARACLAQYDWPGNIRELENAVERAIVIGNSDVILHEDLPEALADRALPISECGANFHDAVRGAKKQLIVTALEQSQGSFTQAAKLLGLHPNYLHRLVSNLDLKATLKNAAKH